MLERDAQTFQGRGTAIAQQEAAAVQLALQQGLRLILHPHLRGMSGLSVRCVSHQPCCVSMWCVLSAALRQAAGIDAHMRTEKLAPAMQR